MPTVEGRALSLQAQYAQERVIDDTVRAVEALMSAARPGMSRPERDAFAGRYAALVLAAMASVAAIRVGYVSRFAQVEGHPALRIPVGVTAPRAVDVLMPGKQHEQAAYAALARLDRHDARTQAGIRSASVDGGALAVVSDHAAASALASADFVDREVLGPVRTVVAFRRVVHPTACQRCRDVAGVLVFKAQPKPRHPQCRCSLEPVYATDADYQARLALYQRNVESRHADARRRGRRQQEAAQLRETSAWRQQEWSRFMRDEQQALADMVRAIPSDTYRGWAILVSANLAESGSGLLPVIERRG